jgi:hypothetical protein
MNNKKAKTTDNKKTKTTDNKKTKTTHGTRPGDGASTSDQDARAVAGAPEPEGEPNAPTTLTLVLPVDPEALAAALITKMRPEKAAVLLKKALKAVEKSLASLRRPRRFPKGSPYNP